MRRLLPPLAALLSLALLALAQPAAAKETPAYIAIGDSLAFGVGAADPATGGYVGLTFEALQRSERYRDRGLELVNLSVPGATSSDLLLPGGQLERALTEIRERREDTSSSDDNVEVITVNIGGNDVLALATPDSPCVADPLTSDCQTLYEEMLGTMEDNLTEVLSRLREEAPRAQIVLLDLYSPISGRGGAPDLIADFAIEGMNEVSARVSARPDLEVDLASVFPVFEGRAAQLIADDDIHPNDDGHAIMAEIVLAIIERRDPAFPEDIPDPAAAGEASQDPLGEGGLQPIPVEEGEGSNLPIILAIAVPAAVLGGAVVAGAYAAARGR